MADAKKCDRCGKYYDENNRKMWLYNGNPNYTNPLDLCEKCVTDLKRWFDKDMGDISDAEDNE